MSTPGEVTPAWRYSKDFKRYAEEVFNALVEADVISFHPAG